MPVEIGEILHVLAHELRTPVGIAHGYIRLLLEGRLADESERRRALDQLQKALARLTDLSHESSALANWLEREPSQPSRLAVRALLDGVMTEPFVPPVAIDLAGLSADPALTTQDRSDLEGAIASLVRSTGRELRGRTCTIAARNTRAHLDVLIGDAGQFGELAAGPDGPHAAPIDIGRGGLGLALVRSSVVLEAHGGTCWSAHGSRQAVGVRLPLTD